MTANRDDNVDIFFKPWVIIRNARGLTNRYHSIYTSIHANGDRTLRIDYTGIERAFDGFDRRVYACDRTCVSVNYDRVYIRV